MHRTMMLMTGLLIAAPMVAAATGTSAASASRTPRAAVFGLSSPDFQNGAPLSTRNEYGGGMGCRGGNAAPRLTWGGVPAGTRGFALTVVDPDAKAAAPNGFVHWVVYNIPGTWRYMYGNRPRGTTGGTSGFRATNYNGPCPPLHDPTHHYYFTLYALNVPHLAGPGLTRDELTRAVAGHVLGTAQLVGTFQRP